MRILLLQHKLTEPSNLGYLDAYARAWPGDDLLALRPQAGFEGGKKAAAAGRHPRLQTALAFYPTHYTLAFYLHRLGALMRRFKPDVIDLHDEPWTFTSAQTLWLKRRFAPNARLGVASAQNLVKHFPPPFAHIERAVLGAADFAYGCSEGVLAVLRHKGYAGPLHLAPLATDPALLCAPFTFGEGAMAQPEEDRWNPAHPTRPARVAYAGKLLEEKGVFVLLAAFEKLRAAAPFPVTLAYLGAGADEDRLRREIARRGLDAEVSLLPRVEPALVLAWLARQDVLAVPSLTRPAWKEQFGRVVVEAFACGVPVAGSNSGSIPEVIGEAGLVHPEGDAHALAAGLGRLLTGPDLRDRCVKAGRERFANHYTTQAVAGLMGRIYRGEEPPWQSA